jgi:hypothetical protein
MPLNNALPIDDGRGEDDEMSWYDESVAANEVDIVTSPQGDKDFSEVTYSNHSPAPFEKVVATATKPTTTSTAADLLLGTLPPAPPLADGDGQDDHGRQARLRNALSVKVREAHKLSKSLIDGGGSGHHRSRPQRKSSIIRKRPQDLKEDVQKVAHQHHQHHSPTGVWEMFDASQHNNTYDEACPMTPVSRFSVIDAIITRQEERRAGSSSNDYSPHHGGTSGGGYYLPSSQPRQQKASLHKEWQNQIAGSLNELTAQSDELMNDILSAEERLYKKVHG